ncbi:MAG: hypothetical protein J0M02_04700 [Planctomycetes bacterium]|nr:hypothetical protein [Planctomycetota bacterium]
MIRRAAVWLLWIAASVAVVIAIGLRVRAARLDDAGQAMRAHLREVPPESRLLCRIVGRDATYLQIQLPADPVWVRQFAERNGFVRSRTPIEGMVAESWSLTETQRRGAIAHILQPRGEAALLTIAWE